MGDLDGFVRERRRLLPLLLRGRARLRSHRAGGRLRAGLPAHRRSAGLRHPAAAEENPPHRKHREENRDAERMSTDETTLAQQLTACFGDKILAVHEWRGETIVDVAP